ncbi:MAG: HNH endonuclease signature motif containing protein [Methanobacterium sp.]
MEISKIEFKNILSECNSKNCICKKLNIPNNGYGYKKVDSLLEKYGLIFESRKTKNHFSKYEKIKKVCPICNIEFETKLGSRDEKVTCSRSCSNTYFRSGDNNPNWKEEAYRTTCFLHHKHECVVCGENLMLDVHHLDGNKKNNKPENLIPLCATHHNYWHSKYRYLIKDKILEYVEKFKTGCGLIG